MMPEGCVPHVNHRSARYCLLTAVQCVVCAQRLCELPVQSRTKIKYATHVALGSCGCSGSAYYIRTDTGSTDHQSGLPIACKPVSLRIVSSEPVHPEQQPWPPPAGPSPLRGLRRGRNEYAPKTRSQGYGVDQRQPSHTRIPATETKNRIPMLTLNGLGMCCSKLSCRLAR